MANSYGSAGIALPAGKYIATIYYGGGKVFYMESRGLSPTGLSRLVPGQYRTSHQGHGQRAADVALPGERAQPPCGNSCYYMGGTGPRIRTPGTPMTAGRTAGWTSRSPLSGVALPDARADIDVDIAHVTNSGAFLAFFP